MRCLRAQTGARERVPRSWSPAACSGPAHESGLAIAADSIHLHEGGGPITEVFTGKNDISLTARLTGEGETREAGYGFRLSDDGGTLTEEGNGMVKHRCG